MRIIGFSWEYPRIGSPLTDLQYLVASVSSALKALGHEVVIITQGGGQTPDFDGIKVINFDLPIKDYPNVVSYGLSSSVQVIANMRYRVNGEFNKVICFEWGGCVMGLLAKVTQPCCLNADVNCIALSTEYERGDPDGNIISSSIASIEGWVFRQCDRVYGLKQRTVDYFKNRFNINADYVPTIDELARVVVK
ncbi:hypothetical protein [Caldivirga maquilingensis]|uniref:Glycosyltransferase subfamily 4-like N-terminal domain-containing protein n=1 Tax=Caldivirga maquilingensis (strain ATCC 700844 / DSM 13496 / JCM 10307 / IC-167) TaxID=397948 RepID=A8MBU7_CALMQ|nr:hypothetical protein [Caldivirga maquilingensis]ABW01290.1 hypothetical protein Cmaq_0445 [Caldivirga maquilingensis IC-167]